MTNTFVNHFNSIGVNLKPVSEESPKLSANISNDRPIQRDRLIKQYLNELMQYHFNDVFVGTVRASTRYTKTLGMFTHRRVFKDGQRDLAVLRISYKVTDDFDRLADTLRHELCHYICYIEGLDFIDGQDNFEHGLQFLQASSTLTGKCKVVSDIVQASSEKGRRLHGMDGIKLTKVSKEDYRGDTIPINVQWFNQCTVEFIEVNLNGDYAGTLLRITDKYDTVEFTNPDLLSRRKVFRNRKSGIIATVGVHLDNTSQVVTV